MNAQLQESTADAEIRELLEHWRRAVVARDLDGIMARYAPDILAFDAIAQLRFKGLDAYRRHWQQCLGMCGQGPMIFEIHDLEVVMGADLAIATALNRCGATDADGQEKSGWMRMTVGLQRRNRRWAVVHEHFSMPFDPETFKVLELTP